MIAHRPENLRASPWLLCFATAPDLFNPAIESVSVRRLLALLLPLLLLVTACSQATPDASASSTVSVPPSHAEVLASVKAEDQGEGKAPAVTFDKPLAITDESMRLMTPGTGAQVKAGQAVEFREVALNAETGEVLDESFTKDAGGTIVLNDSFRDQFPLVYSIFSSAKVGSYIAYGLAGSAATEGSTETPAQAAQAASLSVFQVKSAADVPPVVAPLSAPEGEKVTPPAGLPTVKDDDKGIPQITIGDAKASKELIAQDLIKGKGAVVKATDSIVANYVGVNLVGGAKFDSSFDRGQVAEFSLQQVIKGWTQGLAGKTVGSRVLLQIPADLAYGAAGQGDAKGDLVFVVDILGIK